MKLFLILLSATVSILANVNLKMTAPLLPTSWGQLKELGLLSTIILVARTGCISGSSLLITWVCYKKFGFLELMVAQSIVYVFAMLTSYFFFSEAMSFNRIAAVMFIVTGIGMFYVK